jgi:hypothetical protein
MTPFAGWQNFYVLVGSSASALTGLQFVVIALIANLPIIRRSSNAVDAFSTPTIVHFGSVLLLSGILSAPWGGVGAPTLLCGLCGVAGFAYTIVVARRTRGQTDYKPVFEDWLFHVLLPAVAYGIVAVAAYLARSHADALFGVATAALLLLFIGIHNAWDGVTYLVFVRAQEQQEDSERRGASQTNGVAHETSEQDRPHHRRHQRHRP